VIDLVLSYDRGQYFLESLALLGEADVVGAAFLASGVRVRQADDASVAVGKITRSPGPFGQLVPV